MRNHGTDPAERFRILRERVEACKEIWTNEEATYHGEFVDFDRIVCRPAPLQEPHPPILVGGYGPKVHERVIAYGDAWFPNRIPPDDAMIARVEELQRRGEEAGRGPIPVTLQIPPRDARGAGALRAGRRDAGGPHAPRRRCRRRRLGGAQARRVDRAHPGIHDGGLTSIR